MIRNELFNISESLREDTSMFFLNQPPMHKGDSCCEEEHDDSDQVLTSYPGEPFFNKLQRSYKTNKSIPIELLSTLNIEGMRHLFEVLINDTLNMRALKDQRKTPQSSESESENYKFSNNFSISSLSKQPTFPISLPIAREELKMRRTNNQSTYQKIDGAVQPIESISIIPLSVRMQTEKNDELIVRLYHSITENISKRAMLQQLVRLSPSKFKISTQAGQLLTAINKFKHKYHSLVKDLGKVKIFSQLNTYGKGKDRAKFNRPADLKYEEKCIVKALISAYDPQNLKNFREYAYGLMREHEASEITNLLVQYACKVELTLFGDQLFQTACKKQILENQEKIEEKLLESNYEKRKKIQNLNCEIKNKPKSNSRSRSINSEQQIEGIFYEEI